MRYNFAAEGYSFGWEVLLSGNSGDWYGVSLKKRGACDISLDLLIYHASIHPASEELIIDHLQQLMPVKYALEVG